MRARLTTSTDWDEPTGRTIAADTCPECAAVAAPSTAVIEPDDGTGD